MQNPTENNLLRDVSLPLGYRLLLWDIGLCTWNGKSTLGYRLVDRYSNVIFEGEDFSPGMSCCIDSDESVVGLMGFLTLRPGDTDDEYFDEYSDEQLQWCESDDCDVENNDGHGQYGDLIL